VHHIQIFIFLQACWFPCCTGLYGKQLEPSTTPKEGHPVDTTALLSINFPSSSVEEAEEAAQNCIWNCVAAIDGYHLQITTPSKKDAKNVWSLYSGHYQTYGVNVQASCNHNCKFSFIGVAGPGVLGDWEALQQISLGSLIEKLPGLFCAIGDCAYSPTEHLVPIFRGSQAKYHKNDNFNFYASQLQIQIETSFGKAPGVGNCKAPQFLHRQENFTKDCARESGCRFQLPCSN
jgi:DDE superfamily endonuclease